jgi:undecaprenyl-diphosphatase
MLAESLEAIGGLDVTVFQWLRTHHWGPLDSLMAAFSDLARGGGIWIALAVLIALIHPRRWPAAVQVLLVLAVAVLVTDLIAKPLFNRARPFESDADTRVYGYRPTTRSMPSGHAVNAVAAAYALTRLAPEARATFWVLALLVAVSRVYLGVHYPGDVLVGALLGLGIAKFVVGGTNWR